MKKRVMVLGATGGVGREVAEMLRVNGFEVLACCRRPEQGEALIKEGLADQTVCLSLDDQSSIEAAAKELAERGITRLAGVVNCAAVTWPKPLEMTDINAMRELYEINVFGPLRLIQLTLPLLRREQGRIVLVSSTSGMLGVPLLGAYSTSKFALESMADVLRRELLDWNVAVSLIIPGGIRTPMVEEQYRHIDAEIAKLKTPLQQSYRSQYLKHRRVIEAAEDTAVAPEKVAEMVFEALTCSKPKARYLCGKAALTGATVSRYLPDGVLDQVFELIPPSVKSGTTREKSQR